MSEINQSFLGTEQQPLNSPVSEERTLAILCHVLCIVGWILAPIIIYLVKKDESSFVAAHAKESMNFQITVFIVTMALLISVVGILLIWLVAPIAMILMIVASIKASEGKLYRYPFTLRLIK